MSKWNHTPCERCWFDTPQLGLEIEGPDGPIAARMPIQLVNAREEPYDYCCFCGRPKVTEIWVRWPPHNTRLRCKGIDHDDEEESV